MNVRSAVRWGLIGALVLLLLLRAANHAGWIEPSSSPLMQEGAFWFLAVLIFEMELTVRGLTRDFKDLKDDVKDLIDDVKDLKDQIGD
jgi:hypothetical protein